jgi:predicted metal-binding protein
MTTMPATPRVLIVYYSRTGNTEAVANGLARASGADLEAVISANDRRGLIGYLWSGYEAMSEREGQIHPPKHSPKNYDIVLLGTPTWGAALSSPVRTFLNRYAEVLPEVGFFVTCGGRGSERVLEQMQRLAGKVPLATLVLRECELKRRACVYFGEFWEKVLCAWESRGSTSSPPPSREHQPTK